MLRLIVVKWYMWEILIQEEIHSIKQTVEVIRLSALQVAVVLFQLQHLLGAECRNFVFADFSFDSQGYIGEPTTGEASSSGKQSPIHKRWPLRCVSFRQIAQSSPCTFNAN